MGVIHEMNGRPAAVADLLTRSVTDARRIGCMGDAFLSSDPNAWMRQYWADRHRQPFFALMAPELQALALAATVESEHPLKAREIREWNRATRMAKLAGLDQALKAARVTELWRVRKADREAPMRRRLPANRG